LPRNPVHGAQFRRDVKLAQKRGKDMAKLREVILLLIEGTPLPPRYKDPVTATAPLLIPFSRPL
jgi:mRNA interferase YafQ